MIKHGKEIFRDNSIQLLTIVVSIGLAYFAQRLSVGLANVSIITFFKEGWLFFTSENLSLIQHVLMPFLMYFSSSLCLLWMGVTNLATYKETDDQVAQFLKVFLGVLQLLLCAFFVFTSANYLTYFLLLAFTVVILIEILNYAATFHEDKNKYV